MLEEMFGKNAGKVVTLFVVAVLALVGIGSSIRIVDAKEVCAITQLGTVTGAARTGFQLVTPFITNLDCYPRQVNVYQAAQDAQGQTDFLDYPVEIKTGDGQTAHLDFNVSFYVPDGESAVNIRKGVASDIDTLVNRVIAIYARSVPRDLGPQFTAEELYGTGRAEYEQLIEDELRKIYADYDVELDRFVLRDINFSPEYEASIEAQQIARERIETEGFNALAAVETANGVAATAKGEADAEIERAKGYAEALRIKSAADAEAIRLKGEALRINPQVLNLEFIQALPSSNWMMIPWDQVAPYMPVDPGTMPK